MHASPKKLRKNSADKANFVYNSPMQLPLFGLVGRVGALVLLVACFFFICKPANAQENLVVPPVTLAEGAPTPQFMGPLSGFNLYPYMVPFVDPYPEMAETLPAGTFQMGIALFNGNSVYKDLAFSDVPTVSGKKVLTDYEASLSRFSARWSAVKDLELHIDLPLMYFGGGIFDATIAGFHKVFGFPNGSRDSVADNQFNIRVEDKDSIWLNYDSPVLTIPWIQIGAKYCFLPRSSDGLALSASLLGKIPLSAEGSLFHPSNFDASLSFNIDWVIGQFMFGGSVGAGFIGPWSYLPSQYTSNIIMPFWFGLEWAATPNISFNFTVDGSSSPYRTGHNRLDYLSANMMFGGKGRLSADVILEFGFQEEFATFSTTDISLFTSLGFSIPGNVSNG